MPLGPVTAERLGNRPRVEIADSHWIHRQDVIKLKDVLYACVLECSWSSGRRRLAPAHIASCPLPQTTRGRLEVPPSILLMSRYIL